MVRVLTLNLWSYNNPHDYTVRRGITRGAVPGSPAAIRPAPGGASWPIRRGLVVDLLRRERPDVAGLQEVAAHPAVAGGRNAAEQIAGELGWNVLYAPDDGPAEPDDQTAGLALISPLPLRSIAHLPLPEGTGEETRRCLAAEVTTRDGPLVFLTTHFALDRGVTGENPNRDESARRILAFCRTLPTGGPVVLTGDLNAVPHLRPLRCLRGELAIGGERGAFQDAGARATGSPILTMPAQEPVVAIDYILVRGAAVRDCRPAGTPDADGYYPSDHLGLVADLEGHARG